MSKKKPWAGIDPAEPAATQAQTAAMIADEFGLVTFRCPVEIGDLDDMRNIKAELGSKVKIPVPTPKSGKVFYWMYVSPGKDQQPVFVSQPHVLPFLLGLAVAKGDTELIERLSYLEGMLQL